MITLPEAIRYAVAAPALAALNVIDVWCRLALGQPLPALTLIDPVELTRLALYRPVR